MANDNVLFIYYLLRRVLGEELSLLGLYEFQQGLTDYAISVPHLKPELPFKLKPESGIEAVIEGDSNPKIKLHHGITIGDRSFKLTLSQHNPKDYESLELAVRAIYDIPAIKPSTTPVYRERMPVGGKDRSYLPAIAVLKLLT